MKCLYICHTKLENKRGDHGNWVAVDTQEKSGGLLVALNKVRSCFLRCMKKRNLGNTWIGTTKNLKRELQSSPGLFYFYPQLCDSGALSSPGTGEANRNWNRPLVADLPTSATAATGIRKFSLSSNKR